MSILRKRECTDKVMIELSQYSGYDVKTIREVIDSVYDMIELEMKRGSRETIRLPKLGSLQISKKREMNEIHNIPNGILNRKNTIGVYTNVNPKRNAEILKRYKDEFDKDR